MYRGRMRFNALICLALLFGLMAGIAATAHALPAYLVAFEAAYPAAKGSRIDTCTLCHNGTPSVSTVNSFGSAYASAGYSFTAIANLDSDGDGYTNAVEIAALTFPGNAADHPAATTATLTSLTVSGATTAYQGIASTYTATAGYSDGTSKAVTATWSVSPTTYATISAAGVLAPGAVTGSQAVTVSASYTEGAVTQSGSLGVTIIGSSVGTISNIYINGVTSVNSGATATFTASGQYSDGTWKAVTPTWSVTPATYGSISAAGVFTAATVTANQTVTINASYTEGGITKTASQAVTVLSSTPYVLNIWIVGPIAVKSGATATYQISAQMSDNTWKAVTPTWSVTPTTYASISAGGVLTAGSVTGNQTVTLNASYTEGQTVTASQAVTITNTAPSVLNIWIVGPTSVKAGSSTTYQISAQMSDNTWKAVTPTWSVTPTTYASISAGGVLSAGAVPANQTVTLNASYTEGATKTASQSITITAGPTVANIWIVGPTSVKAGSTTTYQISAQMSDNTWKAVTPTWSVTPTTYASISAAGALTAGNVTANQTVTLNASYTEGVTKTASQSITITAGVSVANIWIVGPTSVNGGSTAKYLISAQMSDNTWKAVTPTWSVTPTTHASISAAGVLTAGQVTGNQTVTVNASYTEGVTKTASKSVTIVGTTEDATRGLLYHDDFSNATADGAPNWEEISGSWTGGNGYFTSSAESKNIALVSNIAALEQFQTGRLQTNFELTPTESETPANAMLIFSYIDSGHYRYVSIRSTRVVIGQVGEFEGEKAGVKASQPISLSISTWYEVRTDIDSVGNVKVHIQDSAGNAISTTDPVASYDFNTAVSGRVGYGAQKAQTIFDEFYAWDQSVLGN